MNLVEESTDFCQKYLSCLRRMSVKLNLTQSQSLCLSSIPFTGTSQTNLAEKLAIDYSTLSRNLDRLVKLKLIKRTPSSYDKRVSHIILTDKGFNKYTELNQLIENELSFIFEKFDLDEQNQISEILNKINWNFELIGK